MARTGRTANRTIERLIRHFLNHAAKALSGAVLVYFVGILDKLSLN